MQTIERLLTYPEITTGEAERLRGRGGHHRRESGAVYRCFPAFEQHERILYTVWKHDMDHRILDGRDLARL